MCGALFPISDRQANVNLALSAHIISPEVVQRRPTKHKDPAATFS